MAARRQEPEPLWNEYKRQSIQQAVVRVLSRDGLGALTMERIAQEVGIAKGTVYLHYRDKQALLDDVKESALAPLNAKLDEILDSDAAPDRKLSTFALRYLGYFDERRDLFRVLLYERQTVRVHGERYQSDRYRHLVERTSEVIRDGIDQQIFREVDTRHVAAMFVESAIALVNQRLLSRSPKPVEDDAALIADLFVRGLRRDTAPRRRSA